MATIIKVDGTREELTGNLDLQTLQKAVGGYIQIIPTDDDKVMVLNEEGKLMGLPVNEEATMMTRGVLFNDIIVGDVVVAERGEVD